MTMTEDLTARGDTMASDGGQHVQRRWHPVGALGVVCVTYSLADTPAERRHNAVYRLHRWLQRVIYAPHEDSIGCRSRGRLLTRADAETLVERWRAP
jgi:hypothetical protein